MTTSIEHRRQQNEKQVLSVIKRFFDQHGFTPTQHQIAKLIGKTRGAVYPRLQRLKEMGEIHFDTKGQVVLGRKKRTWMDK